MPVTTDLVVSEAVLRPQGAVDVPQWVGPTERLAGHVPGEWSQWEHEGRGKTPGR